ncbi:hypothetical protein [Halosimplex halophilum]|uniref:hypothetical protein n=1 Tax=Halosimplex halophilum TaxID=2559572 RepID=UPI00107FBF4F|nr:hypothetical protein [Halosimplex halophilum]
MADKGDQFETLREELAALRRGVLDADDIRGRYGETEEIERSIAAARARRIQALTEEELDSLHSVKLEN